MIVLAIAIQNGETFTLATFTPEQITGPECHQHWGILDQFGCLYAWTAEAPARAEWNDRFRALAQQEAA